MTEPTPFPLANAPLDDRIWALAQLLRRIPGRIEFEGVVVNGSLINDLEDAAELIARHNVQCPKPEKRGTAPAPQTFGKAALRRHYG